MPPQANKRFKIKTYDKDVDDHFIVIVEPWTYGVEDIAGNQMAIEYVSAWLRAAFHKISEKDVVRTIFTKGKV